MVAISWICCSTARHSSSEGADAPHGTGCTFASALAAGLALGEPLAAAAGRAQRYVAGAIAHAMAVGHGAYVLDHFWQTRSG
jgi:hydroxymethylpyrimidine/phosphomethylpyrimidine kinase